MGAPLVDVYAVIPAWRVLYMSPALTRTSRTQQQLCSYQLNLASWNGLVAIPDSYFLGAGYVH
jgi:hypothetical protein